MLGCNAVRDEKQRRENGRFMGPVAKHLQNIIFQLIQLKVSFLTFLSERKFRDGLTLSPFIIFFFSLDLSI